ncbi:hypothetical protein BT96DRAFT_973000 [Gymnopus androsaceus JB14]|uniref:Tautomerase cis-CaaD-like domain-containing protein n=1 Tax=Gymnopus androsaceus JB14 TaxID=1447944 RepID=A0A6A4I7K9_9AGAR|nr:hypothetical protein BT96DRAFT_973000 [Gymnopus androsaceus JB14]
MPFHRWYCSPNLYTKEEKQAIATAITGIYTSLPPFYIKISYFVGGKSTDNFLRVDVQHLARTLQTVEQKREFIKAYEKVIEPFTKGKGINWEVGVSLEDPVLWNINGIRPPPFNTEPFRVWKKGNKPVEWSESELEEGAWGPNMNGNW